MSQIRTRQNVVTPANPWAEPILWYARGVKAMKARPLADKTSWTFFAAIHGIWRELWDLYGQTHAAEPGPGAADTATYLDQCQHQSWYFLPWHRGYLAALEKMIQAEIERLGGPHETWALPYWNYFGSGQNRLPVEFQSPSWPDGATDNPLFVVQRWGPMGGTQSFNILSQTNLDAMGDPVFSGAANGVSAGFGGPATGFSWQGGTSGGLEMNPHNIVHGLVGGGSPTQTFSDGTPLPGLMSTPTAAALDPIFYLHHCNIDRLWQSWNAFPPGKSSGAASDWHNPTDPNWLQGPALNGERKFAMPRPDGSEWTYVPDDMQDIASLLYTYDDLEPGMPVPVIAMVARRTTLGVPEALAVTLGDGAMGGKARSEMIGASELNLAVAGSDGIRTAVRIDGQGGARVRESLAAVESAAGPDRVFLNLENITGLYDAAIFQVYVAGAKGNAAAERQLAGSVSLFGVRQASDPAGKHAGGGMNVAMEITPIIDKLFMSGNFDANELSVEIVPMEEIPAAAKVRIGRISLFRQFG